MGDIILVEDNESLSRSYGLALEQAGHLVRRASNEAQLRAHLADRLPELLILDVGLPGVDGLEIIRGLRQEPATAGLTIAVLSNYGDRDIIHRALRLDVVEYVEKSATSPLLLAAEVRRWLERR